MRGLNVARCFLQLINEMLAKSEKCGHAQQGKIRVNYIAREFAVNAEMSAMQFHSLVTGPSDDTAMLIYTYNT